MQINQKAIPETSTTGQIGLFTRQRLTSLGKVAFWCSLAGMLVAIAGVITLAITNGAPSRDSVITMIMALAITLLILSGIRWLQALAVVIGLANFYLVFTEPFVVESLANPKGPNGGYAHFIGDVLIIGNGLVAFTALVGLVLQNYRLLDRRYPRWFTPVVTAALGLVVGAALIGAMVAPPTAAGVTYTNGVPTVHMSANTFTIPTVVIQKGSKLLLVDDTNAEHILANGTWQGSSPRPSQEPGAPTVRNVTVSGKSVTVGPFVTAGTYHLFCLVHPGMQLTVIVQ